MSFHLLKVIIQAVTLPLTVVLNDCLETYIFPGFIKLARTGSIFRKEDQVMTGGFFDSLLVRFTEKVLQCAA